MEAAIDEQLSLRKLRRQIKLAPDVSGAASKNRVGSRPTSPLARQFKNPLQISPSAAVSAALLGFAQCLMNQVLGQDRLLAM